MCVSFSQYMPFSSERLDHWNPSAVRQENHTHSSIACNFSSIACIKTFLVAKCSQNPTLYDALYQQFLIYHFNKWQHTNTPLDLSPVDPTDFLTNQNVCYTFIISIFNILSLYFGCLLGMIQWPLSPNFRPISLILLDLWHINAHALFLRGLQIKV